MTGLLQVIIVALAALLFPAAVAEAVQPTPTGPFFRVNEITAGNQFIGRPEARSAATLNNGNVVVVYSSVSPQNSNQDLILARIYGTSGLPIGAEVVLFAGSMASDFNSEPSVAPLADGGFVVAWQRATSTIPNAQGQSAIFARRFTETGAHNGGAFQVSTRNRNCVRPAVARLGAGFVVVWRSGFQATVGFGDGYDVRIFNGAAEPQGPEFPVNGSPNRLISNSADFSPSVAAIGTDQFVVAWPGDVSIPNESGFAVVTDVFARRFGASGQALGGEFQVSTFREFSRSMPSVAALVGGGFVIAWASVGQDGQSEGVYAQRYTSSGTTVGSEFLVNTQTQLGQRFPTVVPLPDGGFVVGWDSGRRSIKGQRFTSTGQQDEGEFLIEAFDTNFKVKPSFALLGSNHFLAFWEWQGSADGSGFGIFGQRFRLMAPPAGPELVAAVLPLARSVQVGTPATAFGSIINSGGTTAQDCGLGMPGAPPVPGTFSFQPTTPGNQLIGSPNTPVDIPAGATQSYIFAITPSGTIQGVDLPIVFSCADRGTAPSFSGVNSFILTASTTPVPDMVAIASTPSGDGVVNIIGNSGVGFFAAAAINIGAAGGITASVDSGSNTVAASVTLCQTNASGACINPTTPGATATLNVPQNGVVTFSVFVQATGEIPFDPANIRLFLRLRTGDNVLRGATSVAVTNSNF